MADRLELLNDLRSEQAVRQHAVLELGKGQIPLDTAVAGLTTFLEVGEEDLPSVDVLAVSLTATVLIHGESEPRDVTIKLPVPVRPEPATGEGAATVRVLGEQAVPLRLPASTSTALQDMIQSLVHTHLLRDQPMTAAMGMLSGSGTVTAMEGHSNPDAPQDVETSLLELFEASPGAWYTIAELTHELRSLGFNVEHEKIRLAVQKLAGHHPELQKVTRKSWSWEPPEAQDDDRDYDPDDDDRDHDPDDATPEDDVSEESDAATLSDYVGMEDYVSASDYVDSDGLTTSDIPLEANDD